MLYLCILWRLSIFLHARRRPERPTGGPQSPVVAHKFFFTYFLTTTWLATLGKTYVLSAHCLQVQSIHWPILSRNATALGGTFSSQRVHCWPAAMAYMENWRQRAGHQRWPHRQRARSHDGSDRRRQQCPWLDSWSGEWPGVLQVTQRR